MTAGSRISPGLGALLLAVSGAALVACGSTTGGPVAVATPPPATEILAKPEHSSLTNAHFTLTTQFPVASGVSVSGTGEGVFVYKPQLASRLSFQATANGQTISFVVLSIGGTDYAMTTPGPGKWFSSPSTSNPATLSDSTGATYVGEETLSLGKAWHVKAKDKQGNPFDVWIRESDGYPLKYTTTQTSGSGSFNLTFDKFNTGETITAPPPAQVQASP